MNLQKEYCFSPLGNGFAANSLGEAFEAEEKEAILRCIVGKEAGEVKNSPDGKLKRSAELHVGSAVFTVMSMTTIAFLNLKDAVNGLSEIPCSRDFMRPPG